MLKKIIRLLLVLLFLLTASVTLLFLTGPVIPLESLTAPLSSLFTSISGQHQQVRGGFYLTPGTWTTLEVADAAFDLRDQKGLEVEGRIANGRLSVHLWSLLSGTLRFNGISLTDATLQVQASPETASTQKLIGKEDNKGALLILFQPFETGPVKLENITITQRLHARASPQTLVIDHAEGEIGRQSTGRFGLRGAIDGRAVQLEIATDPLKNLTVDETLWEFTTRLSYLTSTALLQGAVGGTGEEPFFSAEAVLSGSRFNDLTTLFGRQSSENLPFSLRAAVELSPEHLQARLFELKPGSDQLDVRLTANGRRWRTAEYKMSLKGNQLDLDALKGLIGWRDSAAMPAPKTKISREDRIFPDALPLENLAISLDIQELIIGGRRVAGISFAGDMRDRQVKDAPFRARFKNSQASGGLSFDFTGEKPVFSAHYRATALNVGAMFEEMGFVEGLSMNFDSVGTELSSRGMTVGEIIDNLSFTVHAGGGRYVYHDPNTGGELSMALHDSSAALIPGQGLSLDLIGQIRDIPVSVGLSVKDLRGGNSKEKIGLPVTIEIRSEDTVWELNGILPQPINFDKASLHCRLRGKSLSNLNDLFLVKLPDIGPYELAGSFARNEEGYSLDELSVILGSSSLQGRFHIDTTTSPPRVTIGLNSPHLQLDDFKTGGDLVSGAAKPTTKEADNSVQTPDSKFKHLSDQQVMDSYDVVADVEVKEVLSGEDILGGGLLRVEQKEGRLKISPLTLQLPGGTIAIDFSLAPSAGKENRFYRLDIQVDDFDYGILGRHLQPGTDMSGILDLRTSLTGQSPDFRSMMTNADGTITLLIRPEKQRSGVIDLWAVNLFNYITSSLTAESEAKVNCFAGRFQINEGILHQDDLLIDTSRIQVRGELEIDFHRQSVNAYLRPIPKRPQFFSLGTPIKISGKFDDIGVSLPAMGIVGTIVRLATSYIVVPIQWLILNKLPEDGTADCFEMINPSESGAQQ